MQNYLFPPRTFVLHTACTPMSPVLPAQVDFDDDMPLPPDAENVMANATLSAQLYEPIRVVEKEVSLSACART
jgi:hypothetical protein